MLERQHLIRLKERSPDARRRVLRKARSVLPHVNRVMKFSVGRPADEATSQAWDLCLTLHLASEADIEAVAMDPVLKAFHSNFLDELVEDSALFYFHNPSIS